MTYYTVSGNKDHTITITKAIINNSSFYYINNLIELFFSFHFFFHFLFECLFCICDGSDHPNQLLTPISKC